MLILSKKTANTKNCLVNTNDFSANSRLSLCPLYFACFNVIQTIDSASTTTTLDITQNRPH